jgi:hypothetical protein
VENQTIAQGDGIQAAAAAPPALPHRRFLSQHLRYFLLLMQRAGRIQSWHRSLGFEGVDKGREADIAFGRERLCLWKTRNA